MSDKTPLSIIVLDYASRSLRELKDLPHTTLYADADDLEGTTRAIALLEEELGARRSSAGAADRGPVLVIIDGWEALDETLRPSQPGGRDLFIWMERLERLVSTGRQHGLYTIATSSEPLRQRLLASVPHRLVLRQAGDDEYRIFGLPNRVAKDLVLQPGQAIDAGGFQVQIAVTTESRTNPSRPTYQAQHALSWADRLPDEIGLPSEPSPNDVAIVGIEDLTERHVHFDTKHRRLLVVGPPESGKSSALSLLAQQLQTKTTSVYVAGTDRSPLLDCADVWKSSCFGTGAEIAEWLQSLGALQKSACLVLDDLDQYDISMIYGPLEEAIGSGIAVLGSVEGLRRASTRNPAFETLRNGRSHLILQTSAREVNDAFGVRCALRPGLAMPPGRGVFIADRKPRTIQCFRP